MTSFATGVRALPTVALLRLGLSMLNHLGTGLILPFLVVYVQLVGPSLEVATATISVVSAAVMLGAPLAGWLTDRIGADVTAASCLAVQGVGILGYALSTEAWHFPAAGVVVGLGAAGSSAWVTLLAQSAPAHQHPTLFSLNLTCDNLSVGIGGLIGAGAVGLGGLGALRVLYVADAVSCFAVATALLVLAGRARSAAPEPDAEAGPAGSYRDVLRRPLFVLVLVLGTLLFLASYVQVESGLPAFLVTETSVPGSTLGVLFAVNTACILAAQVLLHRQLARTWHVHSVMLAAALWALSWTLVLGAAFLDGFVAQFALLLLALAVFGVAETFHAAGMPTLINEQATDESRGRFNALYGASTSFGFVLGPLAAGALIGSGAGAGYVLGLVGLCVVTGAAFAALGTRLPRRATDAA